MKYIVSLFLTLSCNAQNTDLIFYNIDSTSLYKDLITVVTLDEDCEDNTYLSTTYFSVNGVVTLPYCNTGYNVIIIACDDVLMLYLQPLNNFNFYVRNCKLEDE